MDNLTERLAQHTLGKRSETANVRSRSETLPHTRWAFLRAHFTASRPQDPENTTEHARSCTHALFGTPQPSESDCLHYSVCQPPSRVRVGRGQPVRRRGGALSGRSQRDCADPDGQLRTVSLGREWAGLVVLTTRERLSPQLSSDFAGYWGRASLSMVSRENGRTR